MLAELYQADRLGVLFGDVVVRWCGQLTSNKISDVCTPASVQTFLQYLVAT